MIPLYDDNPTEKKSYIRLAILVICSIVFLFQISSNNNEFLVYYFGFKPASLFDQSDLKTFNPILTIFTSMFMHGGWMHFLGNMLYLWIFADNVEDKMGKKKFILFYILSGSVAAFSQAIINFNSNMPMIGASGAIAGVLGAYLHLFPKAKVLVLVPFIIFFTVRIPAFTLLIFWFIYQFLNLSNTTSSIAWLAHIGGFIFGYIFALIFEKKKDKKLRKKGQSVFIKDKRGPWDQTK